MTILILMCAASEMAHFSSVSADCVAQSASDNVEIGEMVTIEPEAAGPRPVAVTAEADVQQDEDDDEDEDDEDDEAARRDEDIDPFAFPSELVVQVSSLHLTW
jgi:hypothetical protein